MTRNCLWSTFIGRWVVWLFTSVLAISGCGGGSGGNTPPDSVAVITITSQPNSQSVVAGASATFSVVASTTGPALTYQWQESTNSGSTWTAISAANAATYTASAVTTAMNGSQFRVLLTSGTTTQTSSAATLTVATALDPPVITAQPTNQTVVVGATVSFAVTASGSSLSYQWQSSNDTGLSYSDISGATGATYTTGPAALPDSGKLFRAVVSNAAGTATSTPATLSVVAGAAGHYVFALNSGAPGVDAYSVNPSTGVLTTVAGGSAPTGANPISIAVDPRGQYVYVLTRSPNGKATAFDIFLYSYSINQTTGALTSLAGSGAKVGEASGVLKPHPTGRFIYLFTSATGSSYSISAYSINASNGALIPVAGSNGALSTGLGTLTFPPNGRSAYYLDSSAVIWQFSIDTSSGALAPVTGNLSTACSISGGPTDLVSYSPDSNHLYMNCPGTNVIYVFSIDATTSRLTPVSGSPFTIRSGGTTAVLSNNAFPIAIDQTGTYGFVAGNAGAGDDLLTLALDKNTGAPTLAPSRTKVANPYGLNGYIGRGQFDPSGKVLVLVGSNTSGVNRGSGALIFSFDSSTGALASFPGGTPDFAIRSTGVLRFDTSGRFLYGMSGSLSGLAIDLLGNSVTTVPGSPFGPTTAGPDFVVQ